MQSQIQQQLCALKNLLSVLHIVNSSDALLCGWINNLNGWTGQTDLCRKLKVPVFASSLGLEVGL